jgi:hypothetical protein
MPATERSGDSKRKVVTLRLKVRAEAYAWFNQAAIEVNQVWNWAAAESARFATACVMPKQWLSAFATWQYSSCRQGACTANFSCRETLHHPTRKKLLFPVDLDVFFTAAIRD